MSTQQDLTPVVREWLDREFMTLAEPQAITDRVRRRISETPQQRGPLPPINTWRLEPILGTAKLVMAGAITALFGGLVLAGLLARPGEGPVPPVGASPSEAAIDSPPRIELETETVRPGIERVLDDGFGNPVTDIRFVEVAPDGSVWVATEDGIAFQLGTEHAYEAEDDGFPSPIADLYVLRDGTPLVHDMREFATFDGEDWHFQEPPPSGPIEPGIPTILQTTGGDLWVGLTEFYAGEDYRLARLDGDGWQHWTWEDLGFDVESGDVSALAETPDGSIWAGVRGFGIPNVGLIRNDGGGWVAVDPFGDGAPFMVWDLMVMADGGLIAMLMTDREPNSYIGRWDGSDWDIAINDERLSLGALDPEGRIWSGWQLASWDGSTTVDYEFPRPLSPHSVVDLAVTDDGGLWVVLARTGMSEVVEDGLQPGLYLVDPALAESTIPEREDLGTVVIDHPEAAGQLVAHVFRSGDHWFAAVDSVGTIADPLIGVDEGADNPIGVGPDPRAALEDALAVLGPNAAADAAAGTDLGDWEPE